MIILATIFAAWAVGAVVVYRCDGDPRATREERIQYSAIWPVLIIIAAILIAFAAAGSVYRRISTSYYSR